jgi:hypothetical protein
VGKAIEERLRLLHGGKDSRGDEDHPRRPRPIAAWRASPPPTHLSRRPVGRQMMPSWMTLPFGAIVLPFGLCDATRLSGLMPNGS